MDGTAILLLMSPTKPRSGVLHAMEKSPPIYTDMILDYQCHMVLNPQKTFQSNTRFLDRLCFCDRKQISTKYCRKGMTVSPFHTFFFFFLRGVKKMLI
jgi:hypothetical protein